MAQLLAQFVRDKATRAAQRQRQPAQTEAEAKAGEGETVATRIRCLLQSDTRSALCYRLAAHMFTMSRTFAESPGAALHCLLLAGEHSGALSCVRALKSQSEKSEESGSSRRGVGRRQYKSALALEQTESAGDGELTAMRLRMRTALPALTDAQLESLLRERASLLEALATCPSADAARAVLETGLCSLCELLPLLGGDGGEQEDESATGLLLLTDLLEHSLGHLVEGAVADERRADELLEAWRQLLRSPTLALHCASARSLECLMSVVRSTAFHEWLARLLSPHAPQRAADAAFLIAQRAVAALIVHSAITIALQLPT